jgi:hypothetical protein
LLANDLFSVNTRHGKSIKLDNIPKAKVIAINPPRAIVPPKSESINTENPANKTTEVKTCLFLIQLLQKNRR